MNEDAGTIASFSAVTLAYGRAEILRDVCLNIGKGDFIGVVGPNGSGKTTLLRALLGLIEPTEGELNKDAELNAIGYVPQRHALNPYFPLSAHEIVLMGRYGGMALGMRPTDKDHEVTRRALEQVSMLDKRDSLYSELSGGQKQRVLIARALATESPLLLLDEPTNGMDLPSEAEIMKLLSRLHQEGLTIVFVSHNLALVGHYAQRIVIIHERKLLFGEGKDLLTSAALTKAYGCPVSVSHTESGLSISVTEEEG